MSMNLGYKTMRSIMWLCKANQYMETYSNTNMETYSI